MEQALGHLLGAFQYGKGASKKDGERLATRACGDRTRGNGFRLIEGRFQLPVRKKCFMMKVVRPWNRSPREAVDAPSLEVVTVRLLKQPDPAQDVPARGWGSD